MRKILVCTLISVLVLGVTACGASKSSNADKEMIESSVTENTTDAESAMTPDETETIKEEKRNLTRFLEDFMFQLTKEEVELVKSQFVTSRNINYFEGQEGGRRKLPYAFTEQGIYMLATDSSSWRIGRTAEYIYNAHF